MHQCPNFSLTLQIYNGSVELDLVGIVFKFYLYFFDKSFGLRSIESSTSQGRTEFCRAAPVPGSQNNTQIGGENENKKLIALKLMYTVRKPK